MPYIFERKWTIFGKTGQSLEEKSGWPEKLKKSDLTSMCPASHNYSVRLYTLIFLNHSLFTFWPSIFTLKYFWTVRFTFSTLTLQFLAAVRFLLARPSTFSRMTVYFDQWPSTLARKTVQYRPGTSTFTTLKKQNIFSSPWVLDYTCKKIECLVQPDYRKYTKFEAMF